MPVRHRVRAWSRELEGLLLFVSFALRKCALRSLDWRIEQREGVFGSCVQSHDVCKVELLQKHGI